MKSISIACEFIFGFIHNINIHVVVASFNFHKESLEISSI